MHTLRAPLNEQLRKDKVLNWTTECKMAFEKLKEVLTSELFLTHYNPDLDIIVGSDASTYGIDACILHKIPDGPTKPTSKPTKPTKHASRTLLPAGRNYSQMEKDSLSIIFRGNKIPKISAWTTLQTTNGSQAADLHLWLEETVAYTYGKQAPKMGNNPIELRL